MAARRARARRHVREADAALLAALGVDGAAATRRPRRSRAARIEFETRLQDRGRGPCRSIGAVARPRARHRRRSPSGAGVRAAASDRWRRRCCPDHRTDGILVGPDRRRRSSGRSRRDAVPDVDDEARRAGLGRRAVGRQRDAGHERAVDEAQPAAAWPPPRTRSPAPTKQEAVQGDLGALVEIDHELRAGEHDGRPAAVGRAELDPGARCRRVIASASVVAAVARSPRRRRNRRGARDGRGDRRRRRRRDRGIQVADERRQAAAYAPPPRSAGEAVVEGDDAGSSSATGWPVDGQRRWQRQPAEHRVDEHRVAGRVGPAAGRHRTGRRRHDGRPAASTPPS